MKNKFVNYKFSFLFRVILKPKAKHSDIQDPHDAIYFFWILDIDAPSKTFSSNMTQHLYLSPKKN